MAAMSLYTHWLATAAPRHPVMAGLDQASPIRLDAEGAAELGLTRGLPGDFLIAGRRFGGYDEERAIYDVAAFAPDGDEPRTVHLGIDIFDAADAEVFAPMDAWVHSFQDNQGAKDYGPTILLEHNTSGLIFYTLYGHLSRDSLDGLAVGQFVCAGQGIARLGAPNVNGDWPPHLHFQVILDLGGRRGDFPGVCKKSEREQWKRTCPDPAPFLGLVS